MLMLIREYLNFLQTMNTDMMQASILNQVQHCEAKFSFLSLIKTKLFLNSNHHMRAKR